MSFTYAVAAGICVGFLLAGLGGGAALVAVPVLVYLLNVPPSTAVTVSLLIVTPAAALGCWRSWRRENADVRIGVVLAVFGGIGSYPGVRIGQAIGPKPQMLAFGVLMVVVGVLLWTQRPARTWVSHGGETEEQVLRTSPRSWLSVSMVAVLVGLLTGVFGVGGGVVLVPALMLWVGMNLPRAVGTSLFAVTTNGLVALLARYGDLGSVDWPLIGVFTVAAFGGVVIGIFVAGRFDDHFLKMSFAAVVTTSGVATACSGMVSLL